MSKNETERTSMRAIITVYTTDGREWESVVQELDAADLERWGRVLADLKNLKHIYFNVNDALGRNSAMHFHPEKVVAIKLTEATL